MPHKKFPRMSQAQLKRLIKSQNQNLEKAACILEPPKIIQQPLLGQTIMPSNSAYAKKQRKTATRPNPGAGRAGKVPMQVLVEHVEQDDHVKQNPTMQVLYNQQPPSMQMLYNRQETTKPETPNPQQEVVSSNVHARQPIQQQHASELAKEQDGSTSLNGAKESKEPKEDSSGYQTGWYWQSGNATGEKQELSGIGSSSSASFNWPSQGDKSQGTSETSSPSDPFSMQNLKKIARDFFSYPEYHPPETGADDSEATEAEAMNAGALNLSNDNFSISEPAKAKSQPVVGNSAEGDSVADAKRLGHAKLPADETMRRQQEMPLEEAFMTIIRNLRDNNSANMQLDSTAYSPSNPYGGYHQSQPGYGYDSNSHFNGQSMMSMPSAYSRPRTYNQFQRAQVPNFNQSQSSNETYQAQQSCWPVYIPEYVSQFMFGGPLDSGASATQSSHGNMM
ncbi:uncharacterized protein LOC122624464 [Drosophila teissieri]|uniref:uncharacterized protein LOC122624464 n=1 Tax=Drosophila teissieri TaxID=7243 RepID=UPI001CB9E51A|nr:uncharacterized protein LOC122624464 [Drosophila teissieri]